MTRLTKYLFPIALAALANFACSSGKNARTELTKPDSLTQVQSIVSDTFVLPDIPVHLKETDKRMDYIVVHYWDRFDFNNEALIYKPEISEQAFVDYINLLPHVSFKKVEQSLDYTLDKAAVNQKVYKYFGTLFDKYFYGANSPFRNEEFYIPVLNQLIKSKLLSNEEISVYQHTLSLVMKNREGNTAENFDITFASGSSKKMHDIKSEFMVLMFSDPQCSTCEAVTHQLDASPQLNHALSMNSPTRTMITVLTVYTETNIESWKREVAHLPVHWLHAYDAKQEIQRKELYDIKAYPTLYLLDKDKKVILKDTSIEAIESFFSLHR